MNDRLHRMDYGLPAETILVERRPPASPGHEGRPDLGRQTDSSRHSSRNWRPGLGPRRGRCRAGWAWSSAPMSRARQGDRQGVQVDRLRALDGSRRSGHRTPASAAPAPPSFESAAAMCSAAGMSGRSGSCTPSTTLTGERQALLALQAVVHGPGPLSRSHSSL